MRFKRFLQSVLSSIGWWFIWTIAIALVLDIIYSFFHPGIEQVPEPWSSLIINTSMVVAVFLTIITKRKRRVKKDNAFPSRTPKTEIVKRTSTSNTSISRAKVEKIPFSQKKQTKMAEDILANIKVCVSLANKSDNVSLFVNWYDESIDGFSKLMKLDKVKFQSPPSSDYYKLKDEFQWHLCDAIVRAKQKTISDIKNKYRNSREFQIRAANSFECDINSVSSRFSCDTADLAGKAITEVMVAAGINDFSSSVSDNYLHDFSKYSGVQADLLTIDLMDGHAFEHWCAKLLTDIGYSNVNVTQGSGDQGVDVLAQKDGVKYAIQCKCYSKDLGNGPIQEVNAGKSIYHCQIGAVMTNRYFTRGAKDAAEANGILLWDRDWIATSIEERNRNQK